MEKARELRKTGRPRSFDRATALEQAMATFWRYGYEGASIVDLTTAMGVTPPSLYAAFGDKKRLFLEAARLYAGDPQTGASAIAQAPSAYAAARDLLMGAVVLYTGEATPRGCLLTSATASGSAASADVREAVADIRRGVATHLRDRIERDRATGSLPASTDAAALAGLVMAVMLGLSTLARDGLDRAGLTAVATAMLQAWPARRQDGDAALGGDS